MSLNCKRISVKSKAFAAIMSILFATSLSLFGFASLSSVPAAAAVEDGISDILTVEDVSDESMIPEIAPSIEEVSDIAPSVLGDRIAYLGSLRKFPAQQQELLSIVNAGEAYALPSMGDYTFDAQVSWRETHHAKFMDRLDISNTGYAKTVYNNLKKFSDFDGRTDILIEDDAYELIDDQNEWSATPDVSAAVGDIVRQDHINYVVLAKIAVGDNTGWSQGDPRVSSVLSWAYAAWMSYLRDCPEYTYWYTRTLPQISLLPLNYSETEGRFAIVLVTNLIDNQNVQQNIRNSQWNTAEKIENTHADMMATVDDLVTQASSMETDYDKIRMFNEWLRENNAYQYGATASEWIPFTAPAALLSMERGPVCEGYAKAFQLLCQKSSIPVTVQTGKTSEDHMWNLVQLAGKWYLVDVTGNDTGAGAEYFLAAGTEKMDGFQVNDSVTYYLADGTPYLSFPFENAPILEEHGYVVDSGGEFVIAVPEDPVEVQYGKSVSSAFPMPQSLVKTNMGVEQMSWEDADAPFDVLGIQERRCLVQPKAGEARALPDPIIETVTFSVIPSDIDPIVTLGQDSYEYTGSAIIPTVSLRTDDGQEIDPSWYEVSCRNNVSAGTATLTVESVDDAPYVFSKSVNFQIIEKQVEPDPNMTVSISPDPVYGTPSAIIVDGAPAGYDLTYHALKGSIEIIGDSIRPMSIGESEIQVTATPRDTSEGQESISTTYQFSVAKRPLDITVTASDRDYNGNVSAAGSVSTGNLAQGDGDGTAVIVKIESAVFSDANAGENKDVTFTVLVSGDKSNCYIYPTVIKTKATIRPYDLSKLSVNIEDGRIENGKPIALPNETVISGLEEEVEGAVEWFEDAAMTKSVGASATFEGTKGATLALYYKITTPNTNYTGQKTGSATFTFADDPASAGNQNQNQNQNQPGNQNQNSSNTGTNTNTGVNDNVNTGGNTNTGGNENLNANTNTNINENINAGGNTNTGGADKPDVNQNQGGSNTNTVVPGANENANANTGANVNENQNQGNMGAGENANQNENTGSIGNEGTENKNDENLPATDNPAQNGNDIESDIINSAGNGNDNGQGNQEGAGVTSGVNDPAQKDGADGAAMTRTGDAILGVIAIGLFSIIGCAIVTFANRRRM